MPDDFIVRATLAGIAVAAIAGALGCFVVWRRMAYLGDSLAHTALLGIALGILYGVGANLATLLVCSAFAVLLVVLQQRRLLAMDTLLGILAHAGLAVGMLTVSLLDGLSFDLHSYFFGDVLTVTWRELAWICVAGVTALLLLSVNWSSLVLMSVHEDLARAEGVKVFRMHLLLMFLMAAMIAVSFRVVGILLITSMLIIPPAAARQLVRTPEAMALAATLIGMIAVVGGIWGSVEFDTPSGPSIVAAMVLLFIATLPVPSLLRLRRRAPGSKSSLT